MRMDYSSIDRGPFVNIHGVDWGKAHGISHHVHDLSSRNLQVVTYRFSLMLSMHEKDSKNIFDGLFDRHL